MDDPVRVLALLATLAQSSAAIVAIVGGFLVSRLVQLSSERDGLRRRLQDTRGELAHVEHLYTQAHTYRLSNSESDFFDWVIEDLVREQDDLDLSELLLDHLPRGSSLDEMRPYVESLLNRVRSAKSAIRNLVEPHDTSRLGRDDLKERGLVVPSSEEEIYEYVVDWLRELLPSPNVGFPGLGTGSVGISSMSFPTISSPVHAATDARRLDDSIREEQQLDSRRSILSAEAKRLDREITSLGRPAGVSSGIVILSVYSFLGILAPVVSMALLPETLEPWQTWLLVGMFFSGLTSVLAYVAWYARTVGANRAIESE